MNLYKLKENEVVLYKGEISFTDRKKKAQLILTNLNIVFISDDLSVEQSNVEFYSIDEIKIYKNIPQIKARDNKIEIYLLSTEKEFSFHSKTELHKFVNTAMDLLTGKTKAERSAEKVKNVIGLVDDTLGIDTVSVAGKVVNDGVIGKTAKAIGKGLGTIGKLLKK